MRFSSLGPARHTSRCQAIGWRVAACVLAFAPQQAFPQRSWTESTMSSPRTTTVVGVIGDSLHGGPLAGAVVMLDGSTREAVTDSIGRFRIDNVESGHYRVGIFHPILDSLGTSLATRPVQLNGGRPVLVSLATPSGRTLRHALCPTLHATSRLAERRDSGVAVLVGRVLDPETETPVVRAQLRLTWTETVFGMEPTQVVPYERSSETDASGEFRFCGLPAGLNAMLSAADSADHITVERELDLQNRIVTMATLHLATTTVDSARTASLTGEVERPDGEPLAGATAIVEGTSDSVRSDSAGAFVIKRVPSGTHMVVVHAVGFEPVTESVELSHHTPLHVTVAMTTPAYEMSPVVVEAQQLQAGYARVGFSRRRQQGIGRFLTADQIASRHADMLSQIVGVPSGGSAMGGAATDPRSRRSADDCMVYVLNGQPINHVGPNEVDATFKPADVGGVEIYTPTDVPLEFRSQPTATSTRTPTNASGCTTVIVWTKAELGVR